MYQVARPSYMCQRLERRESGGGTYAHLKLLIVWCRYKVAYRIGLPYLDDGGRYTYCIDSFVYSYSLDDLCNYTSLLGQRELERQRVLWP